MLPYNRRRFVKNASTLLACSPLPSLFFNQMKMETAYDVTIFGAGASGLYTAHRLRELGYSVLILESSTRVGGHSETYRNEKGHHVDPGVRMYPNEDLIKELLSKYDITFSNFSLRGGKQVLVDFNTNRLSYSSAPSKLGVFSGIQKFLRLYESKFSFLEEPGFVLPRSVPEDLLMPFSKFLEKYRISNRLAPMVNYLQGFGNVANMTTLYALKNLKPVILNNAKKDSFIAPDLGVEELYKRIGKSFGNDLKMGVRTQSVLRNGDAVNITFTDQSGEQINIVSKYAFISFPPLLKNFEAFDFSEEEKGHFAKFHYSKYYTSLIQTETLPKGNYYSAHGEKGFLFAVKEPLPYVIADTDVPGVANVLFGMEASFHLSDEEIKRRIKRHMKETSANLYGKSWALNDFVLFKNHSPYALKVSPADIANGFYTKMDELQGKKGLYYIGAAMDTHGTFSVWSHAERLIRANFPGKVKKGILINNG